MNEIEIARFNYFASNQLELWQYPDLSAMARHLGTGLSTRLCVLNANFYRRMVKNHLPLFIKISPYGIASKYQ